MPHQPDNRLGQLLRRRREQPLLVQLHPLVAIAHRRAAPPSSALARRARRLQIENGEPTPVVSGHEGGLVHEGHGEHSRSKRVVGGAQGKRVRVAELDVAVASSAGDPLGVRGDGHAPERSLLEPNSGVCPVGLARQGGWSVPESGQSTQRAVRDELQQ